ncbi:MAG: response regulator, partial [Burkholderiaceae bacterium]
IVSAYDSEVMHRSAEELGARHFVAKPVLPESLRDLVKWLAGDPADAAPAPQQGGETFDLAGMRILLVEDNPINQQLAVELLQSQQAQVHVADNGEAALARIHAHPAGFYSAVLMDLQMPVMDGYEATRLLRLDARHVDLPIIAVSAHAMDDERERCLVLGMNGHISKPFEPELLYATLARLHAGGKATRPGPTTSAPVRSSPAPAAASQASALPAITGLDLERGLRYADGRAELYRQMLARFALDHADFAPRAHALLAASQWAVLAREAHTLKGLAAGLGCGALATEAADLERATTAADGERARTRLARLEDVLEPLLSGLRDHFHPPGADSGAPRADAAPPAGALPDWLPRLRELLEQGDTDARELWSRHRDEIARWLPFQTAQRIALALDNFEFDAALSHLDDDAERSGVKQ